MNGKNKTPELEKPEQENQDPTSDNPSRRKLIVAGAVVSAATVKFWGKPMVNSVVLPAHAQTSTDVPDPAPQPDPPAAADEQFAQMVDAPNGPSSQGAQFFVVASGGNFDITIYTDAQNTDLSPAILTAQATAVGTFVTSQTNGCNLDGSTGPTASFSPRVQVVSYTPGVSVVLQFEFDPATYTIPLSASAMALTCPGPQ